DIEILKINKSGGVISQDYWGGPNIERPTEIIIDSHDNLYLIADCEYVNFWNAHKDISILIKNPQSGGYPPTIEELDIKMIFVFSSLGASSTLSIIITIHIIRRKRLKI
ncbi:MAG: hypothetical protein MUP85_07225, partial [Candidatus Lokiarchaeota archaeon]|nr:hypothetical protein [Candidatus Lokiarchaeota archaeon]